MLNVLLAIACLTGSILLIAGVLFKAVRISIEKKGVDKQKRNFLNIFDKITESKIISGPLTLISRNKDLWINKYKCKILELSEAGINLKQLYFLKLVSFMLFSTITLIICFSNTSYQSKIIIQTASDSDGIFISTSQILDKSRYKLYKQTLKHINIKKFEHSSKSVQQSMAEDALAESLNTSDTKVLKDKAEWFVNVWQRTNSLEIFKPKDITLVFLSLFFPEIYFLLKWLVKGAVYKREIIKLEYVFELLSKVDGIKTQDIINQLEKSSKIYSKYLSEFSHLFKYDKNRAFKYLKNKNIKSLSRMANILEIYSLTDKTTAVQILEREIMERDEALIMTADETVDFVDMAAFLSIVPLVYELAKLMLNPMLDIVYKAFQFV